MEQTCCIVHVLKLGCFHNPVSTQTFQTDTWTERVPFLVVNQFWQSLWRPVACICQETCYRKPSNQGCEHRLLKECQHCQHKQTWAECLGKWFCLTSLSCHHSVSISFVSSRPAHQRCIFAWLGQRFMSDQEEGLR